MAVRATRISRTQRVGPVYVPVERASTMAAPLPCVADPSPPPTGQPDPAPQLAHEDPQGRRDLAAERSRSEHEQRRFDESSSQSHLHRPAPGGGGAPLVVVSFGGGGGGAGVGSGRRPFGSGGFRPAHRSPSRPRSRAVAASTDATISPISAALATAINACAASPNACAAFSNSLLVCPISFSLSPDHHTNRSSPFRSPLPAAVGTAGAGCGRTRCREYGVSPSCCSM